MNWLRLFCFALGLGRQLLALNLKVSTLGLSKDRLMAIKGNDGEEVPRRREKRNKYTEFSKPAVAIESLDEAIRKADVKAAQIKEERSAPNRGTTVPTLSASPRVSRKRKPAPKSAMTNNSSLVKATATDIYESIVPTDPYTFGYVQIGKFLSPHGVHGEIKVMLETDFADTRLAPGSILYVKRPHRLTPRPVRVESGRRQAGNTFLLQLESIKTRIGALAFKDFVVYVKQEDRPELQTDEYLVRDLVGLPCYVDGQALEVGTVVGVVLPEDLCESSQVASLMHSMIEVQKRGSKELCLLPLVPQIVTHVDLKAKRIIIDPPAGLLELVYEEKIKPVALRGFLPSKSIVISDTVRAELEKQSISVL